MKITRDLVLHVLAFAAGSAAAEVLIQREERRRELRSSRPEPKRLPLGGLREHLAENSAPGADQP